MLCASKEEKLSTVNYGYGIESKIVLGREAISCTCCDTVLKLGNSKEGEKQDRQSHLVLLQ